MPNPLLKTKLHFPPARPNLVARPRLVARLNEGLSYPLTLISAPPGFGKTTLVTAWLEQLSLPTAWYSLDESDNDLSRFMTYLIAALDTMQADIGRQALNQLHSRRRLSYESMMTLLINDMETIPHPPSTEFTPSSVEGLRPGFVLVLDDYHLIELQAIHEAMTFLIDHLPTSMHLVIATRADPPLPLPRLRARGQLLEVRALDLRFSLEEATAFLNDQMGLQLTTDQVAALDSRAEGWIAGLQLAALSMQGRQDVAGFIAAFAGSHHFVLDYLAQEVLQRQPPEIQEFLLQTCILDQMNASLAEAVTGRNDSGQVLAQLEQANLFVVPLDDARQWYRYHHLFADLLNSRLQQSHPEQIPELHRRASTWYERNGSINEAIDHALAGSDLDRAVRLIEQAGPSFLLRSENATVLNWLARLPEHLIRARPLLCLLNAAALITGGNIDQGKAWLDLIDDTQLDPQVRGTAAILRAAILLLQVDVPQGIESARRALAQAEASSVDPNDPQAEFKTVIITYLAVILAELQTVAGQLNDAVATCRHAIAFGSAFAPDSPWAMILGFVHIQLAELLYEWNDLSGAEQHVTQGLRICKAGRNEELESYALVTFAMIKQVQGDTAGALESLRQGEALTRKRNIASEMQYNAAREIKVLIAQSRIDDAARVWNDLPSDLPPAWDVFERGRVSVARARVMIARREFNVAVQWLESLEAQAQTATQTRTLIEILTLLSLAQDAQGNTAQATTALSRALVLAEPEGYVRTFVDLGEAMRLQIAHSRLQIETTPKNQRLVEYMDRLLAAFPVARRDLNDRALPGASPSEMKSHVAEMAEPLSERELAVLRLIDQGFSNQEIADRLIVAVSTVKTHINNIYGKLGAASRTQALAKAREYKLL